MMDMKVKDFDSYKIPNRKPWAVLVVLLIVGFLAWVFFFRGDDEDQPSIDLNEVVAELDGEAVIHTETQKHEEDEVGHKEIVPTVIPTVILQLCLMQHHSLRLMIGLLKPVHNILLP